MFEYVRAHDFGGKSMITQKVVKSTAFALLASVLLLSAVKLAAAPLPAKTDEGSAAAVSAWQKNHDRNDLFRSAFPHYRLVSSCDSQYMPSPAQGESVPFFLCRSAGSTVYFFKTKDTLRSETVTGSFPDTRFSMTEPFSDEWRLTGTDKKSYFNIQAENGEYIKREIADGVSVLGTTDDIRSASVWKVSGCGGSLLVKDEAGSGGYYICYRSEIASDIYSCATFIFSILCGACCSRAC